MINREFSIDKLTNMVLDLKVLESQNDELNWSNEDLIYEYNLLVDEIIDYLKQVL